MTILNWLQKQAVRVTPWVQAHEHTLLPVCMTLLVILGLGVIGVPEMILDHMLPPPVTVVTFAHNATVTVAYADSLERVTKVRAARIATLERNLAQLKRQLPDTARMDSLRVAADSQYAMLGDSVRKAFGIIPLQHHVIQQQDSTIKVQEKTIATQDTALVAKDSTISDLTSSRDSLRTILRRPPDVPRPARFLFIFPMPTRTQAFVAGTVTGVVLAVKLMQVLRM